MSYKSHDLDLRPQRAGSLGEKTSREPIGVERAVLVCCNAASDFARVHGAREVRLEHLLHALTRVPAASALLEDLGIRLDQLRREATLAIADEASGASSAADGAPAASAPFEEVLRRASAEAGKRQSPASLQDLLRALLDSPAAMLLQEAATNPQRLARWREESGRPSGASAAAVAADLPPPVAEAVLGRLGALETAVQSFQTDMAADRTALSEVLSELRSELAAQRASRSNGEEAAQRVAFESALDSKLTGLDGSLGEIGSAMVTLTERSAVIDRLATSNPWQEMRAPIEGKLDDIGRSVAALNERSTVLDRLVAANPWEEMRTKVEDKLDALGGAVATLGERSAVLDRLVAANPWEEMRARIEAMEGRVVSESLAAASAMVGPVTDRLIQAEASLQHLREETQRHGTAATERQQMLEGTVLAHMAKAEEASKIYREALSAIYDALLRLGTNQHELGEHFSAWRSETGGDLAIISTRVEQLDHTALEMLSQLSFDLNSLRGENGTEGSRLGDNFKRWLHGTSSILGNGWRRDQPAYEPPPSPEAILSRTPELPIEMPSGPPEGTRPS